MAANVDYPRGLEPVGPILRATEYTLSSAYSEDVFIGTPVAANGTGRNVVLATMGTGNPVLGPVIAIYDANKVPLSYWPDDNPGVGYVLVADHPDQLYICQGDGDTTYLDINDCNGNVNLVGSGGSTVNYRSAVELNESDTGGNTPGDQIRLIRPVDRPDNTVGIANADWLCRLNNPQSAAGIVGVGV